MQTLFFVVVGTLFYIMGAAAYLAFVAKLYLKSQRTGELMKWIENHELTHFGDYSSHSCKYSGRIKRAREENSFKMETFKDFQMACHVGEHTLDEIGPLVGAAFWPGAFSFRIVKFLAIKTASFTSITTTSFVEAFIGRQNKKQEGRPVADDISIEKLREAIKDIEGAEELEEIIEGISR